MSQPRHCPRCGGENAPDARFCAECGAPLEAPPAHERSSSEAAGGRTGWSPGSSTRSSSPEAEAGPWLVGRSPEADVTIALPSVSWKHLAVSRSPDGVLSAWDLGSTNGTWYGLETMAPVGPAPTPIALEGALLLGSHRLPVSLLWERLGLDQEAPRPVNLSLTEPNETLVVGRDPACDVVLDDPMVSRRHLRLTRAAEGWEAEDLGSVNGTWYEGHRILTEHLPPDALLQLGSWELRLAPGTLHPEPLRGQVRLDVTRVTRHIEGMDVPVVQDVSFSIFPSEIVGILGDSGSGKTSLLQVVAAVERATGGTVQLNGESLTEHFDRYQGLIGYVPQDDIVHPELTVYQALYYSARLRLPADTTEPEIHGRVERVLEDLDLTERKDLRIGDVRDKTLSGGQRKRVNLGMELVTDPLILFADEPTSGLSYRDSEEVLRALRKVANKGRPVLISIHQPSGTLYRQLDLALILAPGGRLVFFGPTEPDSYAFFAGRPGQPETIFRRLAEDPADAWAKRYEASDTRRRWVSERQGREIPEVTSPPGRRRPLAGRRTLVTLVARLGRLRLGSGRAWLRYLAAPAIILVLLLAIYHGVTDPGKPLIKRANPLFFLAMSSLFFGLFNAATELVAERPIFRRERLAGLGIPPYLLSKLAVLGAITTMQVLTLAVPALALLGLTSALWIHLGTLILTGLVAVSTGLLLSSLAPRPESALIFVPIVLIAQLMLSGFIEPVRSTTQQTLAAPMAVRWAAQIMMDAEQETLSTAPRPPLGISERTTWRALFVQRQGYSFEQKRITALILAAIGASLLLLTAWSLRRRDPDVLRADTRTGYGGELW